MKKCSDFVLNMDESVTLAAANRAKELKSEGRDIIDLTLGQPDFPTPENIGKVAIESIQNGKASYYTQAGGLPELKKAVQNYFASFYNYEIETNQVLITSGAKFGLYAFFQSVLDPGDEVIIPAPYWVSYVDQVKMAKGNPIIVQATQENHFKITVDQLDAVMSDKTKVLLLNSPSNPTGMIYSEEELRTLGNWAVEHDLLILADDIYCHLIYGDEKFTPISSLSEEIKKRTIVINGASKTYAMTGWRIGFAVGDEEIIAAMTKFASQTTSNPTAISQYATIEALNGDKTQVEFMRKTFESRLNTIYPLLSEIPGFEVIKPNGAFYLFPKVKKAMEMKGFTDVTAFTTALLEDTGVALVTGAGFGSSENVRLSYSSDLTSLKEAVQRIHSWMNSSNQSTGSSN
ncbi:pyridoxal phosphate-dependent aminotransferase [Lactococcus fujiensis]|uniref:Aminotransferase n=1 Tax=Lactococcus fujiensis JCM 16395 TaxID=1291764 RepID=A0A2A5RM98_9LACT|nr:pyridoxal phosphate-dependent aminotransferase [Lactococcus fujiensis]PCS00409.1 aspartate aminotransferase [Lactococcus fujiensis JCM 16395]